MKRIVGMGLVLSITFSVLVTPMLSRSFADDWNGEAILITDEDVPL